MVEILVVGGLLAGAIVAFGARNQPGAEGTVVLPVTHVPVDDLPCPWCGADTREDDASCPSCHQPFG